MTIDNAIKELKTWQRKGYGSKRLITFNFEEVKVEDIEYINPAKTINGELAIEINRRQGSRYALLQQIRRRWQYVNWDLSVQVMNVTGLLQTFVIFQLAEVKPVIEAYAKIILTKLHQTPITALHIITNGQNSDRAAALRTSLKMLFRLRWYRGNS